MFPQPRRFGRWIVLAVVVIFVFKRPDQAAHLAIQAWALGGQLLDAFGRFVSDL